MNVPNALTSLRIVLGIIVPILIVYGDFNSRVLAAFLFFIAGITDYFDGWYARKYDMVTKFGAILDPIADKIIILSCFFIFSSLTHLDVYSFWWIVPIFIREVLVTGVRFYFMSKSQPLVVSSSWYGKAKTTVQFITLPVIYFYFMFVEYGNLQPNMWIQGILFGMLIISLGLTLQSGWSFFYRNWKHL